MRSRQILADFEGRAHRENWTWSVRERRRARRLPGGGFDRCVEERKDAEVGPFLGAAGDPGTPSQKLTCRMTTPQLSRLSSLIYTSPAPRPSFLRPVGEGQSLLSLPSLIPNPTFRMGYICMFVVHAQSLTPLPPHIPPLILFTTLWMSHPPHSN